MNKSLTIDELWRNPAFGHFGGIGSEVVNLAFLAGGLFLLHKRLFSWHAPVGMLGALMLMSLVFWNGSGSDSNGSPLFHLLSGATMLGAFFIVTDPVSSATSPRGRLIFGAGVGVLVYVIRAWGGYPDGVAFGVLLMNLAAPPSITTPARAPTAIARPSAASSWANDMIVPEISRSMLKNATVLGLFAIVTVGAVTLLQQGTAERIQAAERAAQVRALGEILPTGSYDNHLLDDSVLVQDRLLGNRSPLPAYIAIRMGALRSDPPGHRSGRLQRRHSSAGGHPCRRPGGWRASHRPPGNTRAGRQDRARKEPLDSKFRRQVANEPGGRWLGGEEGSR